MNPLQKSVVSESSKNSKIDIFRLTENSVFD